MAWYMLKEEPKPQNIVAGSFLPDDKDAEKMGEKELKYYAAKEVDTSNFTLSIYPKAEFENGKSTGSIYVRNEPVNAYPIAVKLIDNKTRATLYNSGAIHPGYEVKQGKLLRNLSKGSYKTTAEVSVYDPKTKKYKGQTQAEVIVTVKN